MCECVSNHSAFVSNCFSQLLCGGERRATPRWARDASNNMSCQVVEARIGNSLLYPNQLLFMNPSRVPPHV